MKKVGIIAEYNPFHNGHLYQIEQIKKEYNPDAIIAVISGNYTQRGEFSSIDKFNKARISVENGINLCVELPLICSIQGADYFSYYSCFILNMLKCDLIIAGSESNNLEMLYEISDLMSTPKFNELLKNNLKKGLSYKVSFNNTLSELGYFSLEANDTLNICYINAIKKINPSIKFNLIKRTVGYNSNNANDIFASASYIRNCNDFKKYVPNSTYEYYLNFGFNETKNYLDIFKYSLINCDFKEILNIDEGLDNYFKKIDFLNFNFNINSKRYSTSRINRALISALLNIKKININLDYVRILSMDIIGKSVVNELKKDIKFYTNIKNGLNEILDLEIKGSSIYALKSNINTFRLEFNNPHILCIK